MSNKRKIHKTSVASGLPGESEWPKRMAKIAGVVLVLGLVAVVLVSQPEIRGVPDGTQQVAVASAEHVNGTIYAANEVPAGGAMDAIWQNCGFYDTQLRAENAVHSMEHGAVWVAYDPNLGDGEISTLRRLVSRQEKVLVSPVAGQSSSVTVSAWGRQLQIDDLADTRLDQFVNEFSGASSAPESGGRCNGGVGSPSF
ncbi:MAG: DUF3105 domain-containing protein [Actinomycetia bacterium]|nr:DUF3105 domain-containing protein [Actinomycetes bacterium]